MEKKEGIPEFLKSEYGIEKNSVSQKLYSSAIETMKKQYKIKSEDELLRLLRTGPTAKRHFFEALKVSETWFFRAEPTFDYLKKLLEDRKGRLRTPPKILSIPCSTGEEPYTIAMITAKLGYSPGSVVIDACDLSSENVERAKKAEYTKNAFRSKETAKYMEYFEQKDEIYHLVPIIKKRVNFRTCNLNSGAARQLGTKYDYIFCRNVLIYFTPEAQNSSLRELSALLKDDGVLFTGFSESMTFFNSGKFEKTGDKGAYAFRKIVP